MSREVWWCETHEKQGSQVGCDIGYWEEYVEDHATVEPLSCRMVPMLLVNPNSLVVEKDVDGNWPEWALARAISQYTEIMDDGQPSIVFHTPQETLDALAGVRASRVDPVSPNR